MSLSTKCLHVSSTLWFKAQLVLHGGILNGRGRKNRGVSLSKILSENYLGGGERGICHRRAISLVKRALPLGLRILLQVLALEQVYRLSFETE